MNFFAQQADARRRTGLLVFFYCCAVVLIIVAVYVAVSIIFGVAFLEDDAELALWNPVMLLWVVGITLAIVGSGTAYKIAQLSKGGCAVAKMLGGRRVAPDTIDEAERRLMNIVEEMAIASGTSVPEVYVLEDEHGINAFAAGFSIRDAVVAVTRGTLERLNRDELQGVIAHEFSHILNGDMRLNIKLTGVLHGILVIALLGYVLMRSVRFSGGSRRNSKGGGGAVIAIFLLGLALWLIGYIGVFFANLIKSAVSRQREFLADASAVQFTRNPEGIGGALKKIGSLSSGSRISNEHAAEAGHFFFANGMRSGLLGLLATHPPLDARIQRILVQPLGEAAPAAGKAVRQPPAAAGVTAAAADEEDLMISGAVLLGMAGGVSSGQLARSQEILKGIPDDLRDAAHRHPTARAVVFGLLLSDDDAIRRQQLQRLSADTDEQVYADLVRMLPTIDALDAAFRMPLAELCISGLRTMSEDDYRRFHQNFENVITADGHISLFEYVLMRMIHRHVSVEYEEHPEVQVRYHNIGEIADQLTVLLSCLARWDRDEQAAQKAYAAAVSGIELSGGLLGADACGLDSVDTSLKELERAAPALKRSVLDACARCVGADGMLSTQEAELLRAIADAFDCPVPPVVF